MVNSVVLCLPIINLWCLHTACHKNGWLEIDYTKQGLYKMDLEHVVLPENK